MKRGKTVLLEGAQRVHALTSSPKPAQWQSFAALIAFLATATPTVPSCGKFSSDQDDSFRFRTGSCPAEGGLLGTWLPGDPCPLLTSCCVGEFSPDHSFGPAW